MLFFMFSLISNLYPYQWSLHSIVQFQCFNTPYTNIPCGILCPTLTLAQSVVPICTHYAQNYAGIVHVLRRISVFLNIAGNGNKVIIPFGKETTNIVYPKHQGRLPQNTHWEEKHECRCWREQSCHICRSYGEECSSVHVVGCSPYHRDEDSGCKERCEKRKWCDLSRGDNLDAMAACEVTWKTCMRVSIERGWPCSKTLQPVHF